MKNLTTTSAVLRMNCATAAQISSSYSFVDAYTANGAFVPGGAVNADFASTGLTTLVPAPAANCIRNIKECTVSNEGVVGTSFYIELYDGTNTARALTGTLGAQETLTLTEGGDWVYTGSDGTVRTPASLATRNWSNAAITACFSVATYLPATSIQVPLTGPNLGSLYNVVFDMVKTAAGTANLGINIHYGVNGNISDTIVQTFNFSAGTAAVDQGFISLRAHFKAVGANASLISMASLEHQLASTGLTSQGTAGYGQNMAISANFSSLTAGAIIGVSCNGGASFSGNVTLTEASASW